ncbi:MAG: addiction module protein [Rhodoferax sp.]|nr:addiction module protein [Rhodoferax sp.]
MPSHILDLEAEVLNLGATERAHLLERLIESFEPSSKIKDAWVSEALRREAEVQAGKVSLVPGQEAVARVRARLA